IFWLRGVYAFGPDRAAVAFNMVPVFTLLVNLALGSMPLPLQVLGMALVFGGVLISTGWRPRRWRISHSADLIQDDMLQKAGTVFGNQSVVFADRDTRCAVANHPAADHGVTVCVAVSIAEFWQRT